MAYRRKRQRGYGRGRRPRRSTRKHCQRGRGPRWDKFKATMKKGINWFKPRVVSAGKKAIPGVAKLLLTPGSRKQNLKNIGKQFGRDLLHNMAAP